MKSDGPPEWAAGLIGVVVYIVMLAIVFIIRG